MCLRRSATAMVCLWVGATAFAEDLHVRGTTVVIETDRVINGSIFIEENAVLRVRNATLTLKLAFDEEHAIFITENSRLILENGIIRSEGGQYYVELSGQAGEAPALEVHGSQSRITDHSGIRPFGDARVTVTGGDVEELQVRERAIVEVTNAAVYPVFFFNHGKSSLANLFAGTSVTNRIEQPGGWSFNLTNAHVEEYQIDLEGDAAVTLDRGQNIVLSLHTPGNLGTDLRVVDGVTAAGPAEGAITNLGTRFVFTRSEIRFVNLYTSGSDRVLLRNAHVNEVNAQDRSELSVGGAGATTRLNCNLCQVYDEATLTVMNATIDDAANLPSATASSAGNQPVGRGVMRFANTDLRRADLTAINHGTLLLDNSPHDPSRLTVVDPTAQVRISAISAAFTANHVSGAAPLRVSFIDLSAGSIDSWLWDFGDGSRGVGPDPVHTYRMPGIYPVSLTIRGSAGESTVTRPTYIRVDGGRRRPVRR